VIVLKNVILSIFMLSFLILFIAILMHNMDSVFRLLLTLFGVENDIIVNWILKIAMTVSTGCSLVIYKYIANEHKVLCKSVITMIVGIIGARALYIYGLDQIICDCLIGIAISGFIWFVQSINEKIYNISTKLVRMLYKK